MKSDDFDGLLLKAADQALRSPCDQMAIKRASMASLGQDFSELLWVQVDHELHNEAVDRGTPCPCGRGQPSSGKNGDDT